MGVFFFFFFSFRLHMRVSYDSFFYRLNDKYLGAKGLDRELKSNEDKLAQTSLL